MELGRKKIRLGDVLIKQKVITNAQLEKALELQKSSGLRLGNILVDEGIISDEMIANALSVQLKCEQVDLQNEVIPSEILNMFNSAILIKNKIFPFKFCEDNPNTICVAMADPMDMSATDDVMLVTNLMVKPYVATNKSIMLAIDKYYGQDEVLSAADMYAKEKESQLVEQEDMYSEDVNNSPIVQLVKAMIDQAVRQNASDIHIEPMERQLRIRYRIDGTLYERITYSRCHNQVFFPDLET
jgi:type IV pilus assembly protein PilB